VESWCYPSTCTPYLILYALLFIIDTQSLYTEAHLSQYKSTVFEFCFPISPLFTKAKDISMGNHTLEIFNIQDGMIWTSTKASVQLTFTQRYDFPSESRFVGRKDHLERLSSALVQGYRYCETSSDNLLCALYALEISLRPIYQLHNKEPPTFKRLRTIHGSRAYHQRAAKAFAENTGVSPEFYLKRPEKAVRQSLKWHRESEGLISEPASPGTTEFMEELHREILETTHERLFSPDELTQEAMSHFLAVLGQADGLRIALGVILATSETEDYTQYQVWVDDSPARKHPADESHDYDGIAWVVNDNNEVLGGGISHWSGVAPKSNAPILHPNHAGRVEKPTQSDTATTNKRLSAPHLAKISETQSELHPDNNTLSSRSPNFQRLNEGSLIRTNEAGNGHKRHISEEQLDHRADVQKRRKVHSSKYQPYLVPQKHKKPQTLTIRRSARGVTVQGTAPRTPAGQLSPEYMDWARRMSDCMDWEAEQRRLSNASGVHARPKTPGSRLFQDVQGDIPLGLPDLLDIELYTAKLAPAVYQGEMQHANELYKKDFGNAPPGHTDLPWEDMEGITIPELIVYFPNHVTCWPGLALILRASNWDQLFHRVASLINRARGTAFHDRKWRQAEPLPCMMKVETAIREINRQYKLIEHDKWAPFITPQLLNAHYRDLPERLQRKGFSGKCTVVEAFEYATAVYQDPEFYQIFKDLPFTKHAFELYMAEVPRKYWFINEAILRQMEEAKWPMEEPHQMTMEEPQEQRNGRPSMVDDFEAIDMGHMADVEDNAPGPTLPKYTQHRRQVTRPCRSGLDCQRGDCHFDHPSVWKPTKTNSQANLGSNERPKSQTHCRFGKDCRDKQNCQFSHSNGKEANVQRGDDRAQQQSVKVCKFGAQCANSNCTRTHPSGKGGNSSSKQDRNRAGGGGNGSGKNGQQRSPEGARPCKFGAKCKNSNCTRSHPSGKPASVHGKQGGGNAGSARKSDRSSPHGGSNGGKSRPSGPRRNAGGGYSKANDHAEEL
jgi:hypothetical protein